MNEELKNNSNIPEEEISPEKTSYEAFSEEVISEEINPEISEVTTCRFCKRELNPAFDFCTYCGKSQRDIPVVIPKKEEYEREIPKAAPKKIRKKNIVKTVFLVLSLCSFSIAFITLLLGIGAIFTAQTTSSSDVFGSLFGSSDNSAILFAILNSVTSLLISLIFTVVGAFFEIIRRMK